MRYQVGTHGVGGRNESWYYAEYDKATGKAYWVHEWSNMNSGLQVTDGEKKIPLEEAGSQSFYEKAVEVIQANHPEWQPLKG
ncbi:hypothetical protein K8374_09995 [Pseudomonas sp. p1(2021b)]|uniref:hypothetical protein n=1 Tax=Pseudomonas sp. p1(2021b) TaxID=2874628 RepID=UPI001CCBD696|nr:hypothetical protein [Pseudomonas sp. p1(2021b)]UBM27255.1 hypothetical protein K8374_09995 [Pseudomonas sp. p1(2021b)]